MQERKVKTNNYRKNEYYSGLRCLNRPLLDQMALDDFAGPVLHFEAIRAVWQRYTAEHGSAFGADRLLRGPKGLFPLIV